MKKKIIIISLLTLILVVPTLLIVFLNEKPSNIKSEYFESVNDISNLVSIKYNELLETTTNYPDLEYQINISDYLFSSPELDLENPYLDTFTDDNLITKNGLFIPEYGNITFNINIIEEGFYNIGLDYFTIEGRRGSIMRGVLINDEYQNQESLNISLPRFFYDEFKVSERRVDKKNDIRPKQLETHLWSSTTLCDKSSSDKPIYYYFKEGLNTITFAYNREPFVVSNIKIYQMDKLPTYNEYITHYNNLGTSYPKGDYVIEAEEAYLKTTPQLIPLSEFQTYKYSPYVKFLTRYNAIGGSSFRVPGTEITYKLNVSDAGLYKLTFKVMQNFSNGVESTKNIKINGQTPFSEALEFVIPYSPSLQYVSLSGNSTYYIYLNQGINTISIESTVGKYAPIIKETNDLILELKNLYKEIVMRTGLTPDQYQDYMLNVYVKNLDSRIKNSRAKCNDILNDIIGLSKKRSSYVQSFDRTIYQLDKFIDDDKTIQKGLVEFSTNISSLSQFVMDVSEQPLIIDQIYVTNSDYKFVRASTNFFEKLAHEVVLFFGSFKDTGDFGNVSKVDGETITVWVGTGKDQTTILRQLIDDSFTKEHNINVNLKMVNMGSLLNASLSNKGPDVAIGVDQKMPVNWGIRNGIVELSKFSDFDLIKNRFSTSAMTPLTFNDKVYGLPDTEDLYLSYYRKDILSEIGINDYPKTWDDVISITTSLQKQHFDYYIPVSQGQLSSVMYAMMIQNGGELYLDGGAKSGLTTKGSKDAFLFFTKLFTDYGYVLDASFVNRFRSGQMPIGISSMSTYNTLSVFAPEITGSWEFGLIPGVKNSDGTYNNTSVSTISSSVILSGAKEKSSWEFLKWWTSDEIQYEYGISMEAILGSAARYPSANLNAFRNLSWSALQYSILDKQRTNSVGIPTVPGDYIVGRHIDNAFRAVLNNRNISPLDSLYNYTLKIDEELTRKRTELGL
jgi:ABC-type glycerol-3-phosphate transport system substrate-binding protein